MKELRECLKKLDKIESTINTKSSLDLLEKFEKFPEHLSILDSIKQYIEEDLNLYKFLDSVKYGKMVEIWKSFVDKYYIKLKWRGIKSKYDAILKKIGCGCNEGVSNDLTLEQGSKRYLNEEVPVMVPESIRVNEYFKQLSSSSFSSAIISKENNPWAICVIPGTKILMEDLSLRNIEDIQVGDKVITHTGKVREVLTCFSREVAEELNVINGDLYITDFHPVLVESEFKLASDLRVGDSLTCPVPMIEDFGVDITETGAAMLGLFCSLHLISSLSLEFLNSSVDLLNSFLGGYFKRSEKVICLSSDLEKQIRLVGHRLGKTIVSSKIDEDLYELSLVEKNEVRKLDRAFYVGRVYNIEVAEDNSYVANLVSVHNCNKSTGGEKIDPEGFEKCVLEMKEKYHGKGD